MTGLLLLTFVSGAVDAVSIVALDGVFAANQTGNLVLLPLVVAGWSVGTEPGAVIASLGAFVLAVRVAGRLVGPRRGPDGPAPRVGRLIAIEVVLLLGVIASWAATGLDDPAARLAVTVALAAAMGVQAAAARRLAIPGLPTVVVTSVLVGLATEPPGGRRRAAVTVTAMAGGALLGGLALHASTLLPLLLALGPAVAAWRMVDRPRAGPA